MADLRHFLEIDDLTPFDPLGMIEDVARECLPTSPAKGPEGRGLALGELFATSLEVDVVAQQPQRQFRA